MPVRKTLPKPPLFAKIIGPSFIFLGLGLGSGELIVWPYLVANYGMGIIWAAVLGLTLQFFMNMEIERYALARGESIFVGFWRKAKWMPAWFLLSTFVPWLWPGLVTTSAKIFSIVFGFESHGWIGMVLLIAIGVILSLGKTIYKTVEKFQKSLIFISVPFIFGLSLWFAEPSNVADFAFGMVGKGDGYWLLPKGIILASFLAGLAYSGAGGNLNLAQSFYIKDKGYGMGKYAEKIKSLFAGKSTKNIKLTGNDFANTKPELKKFNAWWKLINLEHGLVFWMTGGVTIVLLCLLAFNTSFGKPGIEEGINFLLLESSLIGAKAVPFLGTFFLLVVGVTLFATQLTVFDATSRILAENISLLSSKLFPSKNLSKYYYVSLWLQIFAGIGVLAIGFDQPLTLIILAASLNAVAMFVHSGLTLWVNKTLLIQPIRPNTFRTGVMIFTFLFFGLFSLLTLLEKLGF